MQLNLKCKCIIFNQIPKIKFLGIYFVIVMCSSSIKKVKKTDMEKKIYNNKNNINIISKNLDFYNNVMRKKKRFNKYKKLILHKWFTRTKVYTKIKERFFAKINSIFKLHEKTTGFLCIPSFTKVE